MSDKVDLEFKYEQKICSCNEPKIAGYPKKLGGRSLCICGGAIESYISNRSIIKAYIFDRLIELSIFYGEIMNRQDGELKERYKNELKQRFEELLHLHDYIDDIVP